MVIKLRIINKVNKQAVHNILLSELGTITRTNGKQAKICQ